MVENLVEKMVDLWGNVMVVLMDACWVEKLAVSKVDGTAD